MWNWLRRGGCRWVGGRIGALWCCHRASVVTEWALTVPVLLLLIGSTIELGMMTLADLSLQQGVETAARSIRTGDIRSESDLATFRTKVCANVLPLVDCSSALINVQTFGSISSSYSAFGDVVYPVPIYDENGNLTNYSFGVGGTKLTVTSVQVRATYHFIAPVLGYFFNAIPDSTVLSHAMILVTEPF